MHNIKTVHKIKDLMRGFDANMNATQIMMFQAIDLMLSALGNSLDATERSDKTENDYNYQQKFNGTSDYNN
jgi:hypothetical protein